MNTITRDDWIKAIAEAMPPPPVDDAITAPEFAAMAHCCHGTARVKLRAMVKAGTAREVRKRIVCTDGRAQIVTAFQLVKKSKAK